MKDILFVEKYRPSKLDDIIGQDVSLIKSLIKEPIKMPNFLFISRSPGTGKTSTAYAIRNDIGCPMGDFLTMNSSDERKMEHIRDTIKPFATSMRAKKEVPKLIHMDEFDGMLTASQEALRPIMEKYSSNVRFILTANDESQIIEPIKSRCVIIRFKEPDKEKILDRLSYICEKECIKYDSAALKKIIDIYYPDIRQMINELQRLSSVGIKLDFIKTKNELEDQFYNLLKTSDVYTTRRFFIEHRLDSDDILKFLLEKIIENEKDEVKVKDILFFAAEIEYRMTVGSDKEIQMFAFILKYYDLFRKIKVL